MRAADVVVGETYGRWTVLGPFQRQKSGAALFPCQCACGTEKEVQFRGRFISASCGCLRAEQLLTRNTTHGGTGTRLHRIWKGMWERCSNPNRKEWPNYGGRGIGVAEEWWEFAPFRDWALASGYAEDLDIDRLDNDSDYSPENCHWVTRAQNLRNTRRSRMLTVQGETKSMADWVEDPRCSLTYAALEGRLRSGWAESDAVLVPPGRWNPQRPRKRKWRP